MKMITRQNMMLNSSTNVKTRVKKKAWKLPNILTCAKLC